MERNTKNTTGFFFYDFCRIVCVNDGKCVFFFSCIGTVIANPSYDAIAFGKSVQKAGSDDAYRIFFYNSDKWSVGNFVELFWNTEALSFIIRWSLWNGCYWGENLAKL